jgi:hypothetical protein
MAVFTSFLLILKWHYLSKFHAYCHLNSPPNRFKSVTTIELLLLKGSKLVKNMVSTDKILDHSSVHELPSSVDFEVMA